MAHEPHSPDHLGVLLFNQNGSFEEFNYQIVVLGSQRSKKTVLNWVFMHSKSQLLLLCSGSSVDCGGRNRRQLRQGGQVLPELIPQGHTALKGKEGRFGQEELEFVKESWAAPLDDRAVGDVVEEFRVLPDLIVTDVLGDEEDELAAGILAGHSIPQGDLDMGPFGFKVCLSEDNHCPGA